MTVAITHKFQSAKSNGADNTQVQPSNWNDTHNIQCAANSVLGNSSGVTGAVTELPLGALGLSLLAANVLNDLVNAGVPIASTGDVKLTFKTAADTGWIMMNDQTIGPAGSTATYANNNCQALYTLLWNNVPNTYAPVTGGRGSSAAADWLAEKPLQLCAAMGRALGVAGAGSGLTSRALGQAFGEESHTLAVNEIPQGLHSLEDPGHTHTINSYENPGGTAGLELTIGVLESFTVTTAKSTTGITLVDNAGGGSHNNIQPTVFINAMIKL